MKRQTYERSEEQKLKPTDHTHALRAALVVGLSAIIKKKAIEEMIRVAKPGSRILICDEKEQAAQAYEHLIPGFMKNVGKERFCGVAVSSK